MKSIIYLQGKSCDQNHACYYYHHALNDNPVGYVEPDDVDGDLVGPGDRSCSLKRPGWKGTEKWSDEDRNWEWKGGGGMTRIAAPPDCFQGPRSLHPGY